MESRPTGEAIYGQDKNPFKSGIIVSNIIKSDELSLYEQAAQRTGFGISVDAREGEQHTFWYEDRSGERYRGNKPLYSGMKDVTVGKGMLGIQITRPEGQTNHQAFWDECHRLKAEQNPTK